MGQKVDGLGRGDVAGIVIGIRPHEVGTISGPGSIIVKPIAAPLADSPGTTVGRKSKAKRTSLKPVSSLSKSRATKPSFGTTPVPVEEEEEDEYGSDDSAGVHAQVDKDAQRAQRALLSHCAAHAPHCKVSFKFSWSIVMSINSSTAHSRIPMPVFPRLCSLVCPICILYRARTCSHTWVRY